MGCIAIKSAGLAGGGFLGLRFRFLLVVFLLTLSLLEGQSALLLAMPFVTLLLLAFLLLTLQPALLVLIGILISRLAVSVVQHRGLVIVRMETGVLSGLVLMLLPVGAARVIP